MIFLKLNLIILKLKKQNIKILFEEEKMSKLQKDFNYYGNLFEEYLVLNKTFQSNFCKGDNVWRHQYNSPNEEKITYESELDKVNQCIEIYDKLIDSMKRIFRDYNDIIENAIQERNEIVENNNHIVDEIVKLENRLTMNSFEREGNIKQHQLMKKQIIDSELNKLKREYKRKIEELNQIKLKVDSIESISNYGWNSNISSKIQNEMKFFHYDMNLKEIGITMNESKQLEEWTGKRIGSILFDSNKHNWNTNTSVFESIMFGKSHFYVIIEDNDGNKFGGYVDAQVTSMHYSKSRFVEPKGKPKIDRNANNASRTVDRNAFLFSLKRSGNEKFTKYPVIDYTQAFVLTEESCPTLFHFGGFDIRIERPSREIKSYCSMKSYDYHNETNPLRPVDVPFTPKRIITIQMV